MPFIEVFVTVCGSHSVVLYCLVDRRKVQDESRRTQGKEKPEN